jgi:hypothetical protein
MYLFCAAHSAAFRDLSLGVSSNLGIDDLPLVGDLPQTILGTVVADSNVAASLEAVWNQPGISAVLEPISEVIRRHFANWRIVTVSGWPILSTKSAISASSGTRDASTSQKRLMFLPAAFWR